MHLCVSNYVCVLYDLDICVHTCICMYVVYIHTYANKYIYIYICIYIIYIYIIYIIYICIYICIYM